MIIVTGGAGFIGSNLVAALEARHEGPLVVCDHEGAGDDGKTIAKRRLKAVIAVNELGDYLNAHADDVRAVFHLGATSSTMVTDASLFAQNNYRVSLDLWRWCAAHDVPLIYASSAATYGDGSNGFDDDGSIVALAKLRPLNPYGRSKHLFDRRVAHMLAARAPRPPQWAGLKFFNVYGPNEYHKGNQRSVVCTAYPAASSGDPVRLFKSYDPGYPDGGQLRDFVWVGDCVAVMLWLLDHPAISGLFNIGTGTARSFADLARALFTALDQPAQIDYIEMPKAIRSRYQYFTEARMERLRHVGYAAPFTSLEDGVGLYVRDYLSQADPYR
jgi:ADP-L-glycero-D-manno-heptose 6-epimerase